MPRPDVRVAVYGDVNLNLLDGSAIWVQSVVEAFSGAGCRVSLLLKAPVQTPRLTDHIMGLDRVTVVKPFEDQLLPQLRNTLSPPQALTILQRLDDQERFDVVVLRGFRLARQFAASERFRGRTWTYLTDVPQSLGELDAQTREQVAAVALGSELLLCQTDELRGFLETTVPEACGKCLPFPPVVPTADVGRPERPAPRRERLRLSYMGKFAPRWNTLEMTRLPALLAERGIRAELHAVGDKIHSDPGPSWSVRMRVALERSTGVVWHGGKSRQEAMRLAADADVGMGWRAASLDTSLELSTKVLEYGSLGLPVVLNRTRPHEDLLGADYPLFANTEGEVLDALERVVSDEGAWSLAAERCRRAAANFTLDHAVARVECYLDRTRPRVNSSSKRPARPLKVVVASHDLKFFTRLLEHLQHRLDLEVRIDEWTALAAHDERASRQLLQWADVIICEWCGPNAIWYSHRKQPHQRLIVRLHRFELDAGYGQRVDIDKVDQVVCVSPHYAALTRGTLGWPADKVVTIPNWVDLLQLDRPKYPGARHHLGMIGIAPSRKRLDLALDVLEEVRAVDERFVLFVKTKMPWEYWWIWKRQEEREHYEEALDRIQTSELLRGAVVFDAFGGDVGSWLRKIGFVLSTSDDESFHLSPAEGMASRAVPVVRRWPGAETIYEQEWLRATPSEMARAVLDAAPTSRWQEAGRRAQQQVSSAYGLDVVRDLWDRVIQEDLPPDPAASHAAVSSGRRE